MDLTWSPEEQAFRAEVREWLAANVPAEPLPSGDTREGFARHLEWERRLFDARFAVRVPGRPGHRGNGRECSAHLAVGRSICAAQLDLPGVMAAVEARELEANDREAIVELFHAPHGRRAPRDGVGPKVVNR